MNLRQRLVGLCVLGMLLWSTGAFGQSGPQLTSWIQNPGGVIKGQSTDATINALVSQIPANVQQVRYTATDVYVNSTDVPSYSVGPFPGDPAYPSNRNLLYDIPLNPQPQSGQKTATGLGPIGVFVNGVDIFNPRDANSYLNQNVWHQNAVVVEASSFDAALGHPAPVQGATGNPQPGEYHHHQQPVALLAQLGDTGLHHSPLIGYAFDGYPVYGPYGFINPNDPNSGVKRMSSSFSVRNITTRTTLPNGQAASSPGPAVSTQFPLGYYVEDYQFVAGSGDLDQFNMRFTVTPEYPQGTLAYFASTDSLGQSMYPYIIGPNYFGVVKTEQGVTVPANAVIFTVPEPASIVLAACGLGILLCVRRQKTTRP